MTAFYPWVTEGWCLMANSNGAGAATTVMAPPDEDLNRSYWEDDLEMPLARPLEWATNQRFMKAWAGKVDGRVASILCHCLGEPGLDKLDDKRKFLRDNWASLRDYHLVEAFAFRKSKVAVQDVALMPDVLPKHILDLCETKSGEYDPKSLLFALYHESPEHLRLVFHLDKIHKSGFARMVLPKPPRAPQRPFCAFAQTDAIPGILDQHNQSRRDHRPCELKRVLDVGGGHTLVFIRRPHRNQHILPEDGQDVAMKIVHGYSPEWIVLDFYDNARIVGISSLSNDVPLDLANRIASAYFGVECEYVNQCSTTYPAQIALLLSALKAGDCKGIDLLQFQLRHGPFKGSPALRIGPADPVAITKAIADLEANYQDLFSDIPNVEKIKVEYVDKKVEIRFEQEESEESDSPVFVVRYFDHRLNLQQRYRFEEFMRTEHGIEILSTEKRFKRKP